MMAELQNLPVDKIQISMSKTQEQQFLQVKEGLDYFRLPTIFPIEATPLLSQLLALLRKRDAPGKENINAANSADSNVLNEAVKQEIGRVQKQNNRLHMEIMAAREQIQAMQYSMDKFCLQRKSGKDEIALVLESRKRREDELFEELNQVKYKYNELMDLVHEDASIQKMYIKRLMKHRRLQIEPVPEDKGPSAKKSQSHSVSELESKLILIQNKLSNRETEIVRLQKKMETEGLNLNKFLKDFHENRSEKKVSVLEEQVKYLEQMNKKLKKEVKYCKTTGGKPEALREEIAKNHETISNLSKANKQLREKLKQKDFDVQYMGKEEKRKSEKVASAAKKVQSDNELATLTIADLQKRCEFLSKELSSMKEEVERQRADCLNKDILIEQMKNTEEGEKILNHYELESAKQKLNESESLLNSQSSQLQKLSAENQYLRDEGLLKSEAIENLEKIVDEMMRQNRGSVIAHSGETHALNLQNTISLRKALADAKQALSIVQAEKSRADKELDACAARLEHKNKQNIQLLDEVSRLKMKVMEMKSDIEEVLLLQRNMEKLELDGKREQNARIKAESALEISQAEKTLLRREMQEITQEFQIYEKKAKNHLNSQKLEMTELEEANNVLGIRMREKDSKLGLLEDRCEELSNKVKILKDQVTLLEDEKHAVIREKHRLQKRFEELLRVQSEKLESDKVIGEINSNEQAGDILWHKKELARVQQKMEYQAQHINQLTALCESWTKEREALVSERIGLVRENDHLKAKMNEMERLLILQKH